MTCKQERISFLLGVDIFMLTQNICYQVSHFAVFLRNCLEFYLVHSKTISTEKPSSFYCFTYQVCVFFLLIQFACFFVVVFCFFFLYKFSLFFAIQIYILFFIVKITSICNLFFFCQQKTKQKISLHETKFSLFVWSNRNEIPFSQGDFSSGETNFGLSKILKYYRIQL